VRAVNAVAMIARCLLHQGAEIEISPPLSRRSEMTDAGLALPVEAAVGVVEGYHALPNERSLDPGMD